MWDCTSLPRLLKYRPTGVSTSSTVWSAARGGGMLGALHELIELHAVLRVEEIGEVHRRSDRGKAGVEGARAVWRGPAERRSGARRDALRAACRRT